jgi:hypothetical protein
MWKLKSIENKIWNIFFHTCPYLYQKNVRGKYWFENPNNTNKAQQGGVNKYQ